jgi:hypothetical protein
MDRLCQANSLKHDSTEFAEYRSGAIGLIVLLVSLFRQDYQSGVRQAPELPLHCAGPRFRKTNQLGGEEGSVGLAKK